MSRAVDVVVNCPMKGNAQDGFIVSTVSHSNFTQNMNRTEVPSFVFNLFCICPLFSSAPFELPSVSYLLCGIHVSL